MTDTRADVTISAARLLYLTRHHEITETWIGIARLRLDRGEPPEAKRALAKCSDEITREMHAYMPALAELEARR